jgi:2-aminoethylphosphonate-pyruvate transaminase
VINPPKLTDADPVRIGCIGRLYPPHMEGALLAVREVLDEMRVSNGGPALAAE